MSLSKISQYVTAAGLFGLAVYQISTGDVAGAVASVALALADLGIKVALPAPPAAPAPKGE